ncbi:RNA polymerase sigma factor [Pedobacter psychrodurus]|nr:RNA polymerase sigma-70 factor [Pedobacter psychrodurus]
MYFKYREENLLALLRSGDELAFNEIYRRNWQYVFTFAASALNNAEDTEECVQDIFCSIWLRKESLFLRYSLQTYLSAAVKYRVINILDRRYRKRQKMVQADPYYFHGFSPSPEVALLEKELVHKLELSIARLPEKCRLVYKMSRYEGKTHRQIAEELNISRKTVNNHLTKALKDLSGNLLTTFPLFIIYDLF